MRASLTNRFTLRVVHQVWKQDLKGNHSTEGFLLRLIYAAHTAFTTKLWMW